MERFDCGLIELKFDGSPSTKMTFSGYGAAFKNVDSYGDMIIPGAFAQTIADAKSGAADWPKMLSQHGAFGLTSQDLTPIGMWTELGEDSKGLQVEGELANTARGVEMHQLMKMQPRAPIDKLSIGYKAIRFKNRSAATDPRRTLEEIKLIEVSPVTFAANGEARIGSVKADMTEREFERWLMQDAGFTRSEARIILNQGFKSLPAMRDAGDEGLSDVVARIKRNTAILQPV